MTHPIDAVRWDPVHEDWWCMCGSPAQPHAGRWVLIDGNVPAFVLEERDRSDVWPVGDACPECDGTGFVSDEMRARLKAAGADLVASPEYASEYGRLLAERDRLIADGADPAELLVPLPPPVGDVT